MTNYIGSIFSHIKPQFYKLFIIYNLYSDRPLSFAHKISSSNLIPAETTSKEKVWNLDLNDDDVDLVDPDALLDEQDLVKPDPESLRGKTDFTSIFNSDLKC